MREAQRWYESRRTGLGDELLEEIRHAIGVLEEHSERCPIYDRGFRRLLTRRFPNKLFYRIVGDPVIVFRILHTKRNHRQQLGG